VLTALRVVRLVDAAALAEECGGGAVAMAWLVLAIVSGAACVWENAPSPGLSLTWRQPHF
jgi:acyl dehydratase